MARGIPVPGNRRLGLNRTASRSSFERGPLQLQLLAAAVADVLTVAKEADAAELESAPLFTDSNGKNLSGTTGVK